MTIGTQMPKRVDHLQRRQQIAEAVLRLVSEGGIAAASLRTVATEAGVSMGAVQHYFTSTSEMLRFALDHGNRILTARIQETMAERSPGTGRETIRLLCTLLLPLDSDGRAGARLWAAFLSHACVDQATARLAADAYASLTAFAGRAVSQAVAASETAEGIDADWSARQLVTVIEGLRWPLLFGVYGEHEALNVLDAQLDEIFAASPEPGRRVVPVE